MDYLFTTESLISFFILVVLEIVLGIDNVIFVSIIINQLEQKDERKARRAWMINGIIVRSVHRSELQKVDGGPVLTDSFLAF